MRSIPPAVGSDAEDVVWALQTADALWRRSERVDAIVWLRRAAQSAGEVEDDDRALQLAREAAELAEWLARRPATGSPSTVPRAPPSEPPRGSDGVDALLDDGAEEVDLDPTPVYPAVAKTVAEAPSVVSSTPPSRERVLTAAEVHAGMLDPWAEGQALSDAKAPDAIVPSAARSRSASAFDADELVTSAPMVAARPARPPSPLPPQPPRATESSTARVTPPPLPPEAKAHSSARMRAAVASGESAPGASTKPAPATSTKPAPAASTKPAPAASTKPAPAASTKPAPAASTKPAPGASDVDLSHVDALSDLPDDARLAFADAATVRTLAREDEVSGFALALVLEGSVDLSATIVDAPAQRLDAGAVLRARGTIEAISPVRLVGAAERSRVATWDEQAVTDAFRTCPWVEDELRAAGDLQQALVGITMGPLGERLDPSLRADVAGRLRLRALSAYEAVAMCGDPVPGMLVVGAGELELLGADGSPNGVVVRPGEFLFSSEALRAARAPNTVRAAQGGALVLMAERGVAQELLLTYPTLLEIFAGM